MHYICIVKTTRPGGKTRNAPADMKETIQANIGSVAFTLDRDAYDTLKEYLDAVRDRLPEHDTETLDDIERHFAEIFGERIASPMQVVSLETVNKAIKRMGRPADFGDGPADARTRNPAPHEILRPLRRTVADWPGSSGRTLRWSALSRCCCFCSAGCRSGFISSCG